MTVRGRRARARRLSPHERQAQLLDCAMRVFARRGLGEARHAEVAAEAEVSEATVFVYFATRPALLGAVLGEVERFLVDMAERIHARPLAAAQNVLDHVLAFADSVDTHPHHARVWLDWSTAMREEVWPRYLALQERVVRVIQRTLERGQRDGTLPRDLDPEDDARLLVGTAHMIAQMKFTRCPPEKMTHFLHTVVRAALGGGAPAR